MKEQIKEMAKDIASTPIGTVKPDLSLTEMGEVYKGEFIGRIAKHLYSADYRKQSEGEWIFNRGRCYGEPAYYCSNCSEGASEYGMDNFCPNCGAHMKGATDERAD